MGYINNYLNMASFINNKIYLDIDTVSEQLRSARQFRGLKIKDIAQKLNIKPKYIDMLEKGDFAGLPRGAYGKNFLREYCIFLNLDYEEIKTSFEKEIDITKEASPKDLFSFSVAKVRYFLAAPKIIKNVIITTVVLAFFFYLGSSVKNIVSPPSLLVEAPSENYITNDKIININGIAESESQIIINGESVLSDTSGRFSKKINLKKGLNVITVIAKKKYSRENVITRQILVKEG